MKTSKIILFDGVCNLCNSTVQRIIRNDDQNKFQFASLQSDFGQKFLQKNQLNSTEFKSLILIDENHCYFKSDAALRIGKELKGIYKISSFLLWIPKFIRDFGYDFIAKNRYKWFGKSESCWLPTPELKQKFID
ncbi:MAG: thiol-disulfide oxidoreductase DCC family protein [Weeksellaceae bacterium]|jgi:predicted DCC family thiol-disulfide oxidoreductase YuxK|nr:thiol-disulfide oxidoreductase DCC family protein [Weeksellaceae bacterium]MDX9705569.1 thiol-disulfide oxidoreductase DCC family protein [Weeksellaceae bacterium]